MGIKSYLQRIPKNKGFNSLAIRKETVNLGELDLAFKTGELVDIKALAHKGLIRSTKSGLKVLAGGKLTKPLIIQANAFSESAKEAIIKAGGKAEEIKKEKVKNQKYALSRVKKSK
jgi:large subunit ribosomal protein L15